MSKQFIMGNEAIALGAIRAGVGVVTGYPGTPSTEVLESVVKHNPGNIYVEWSVNEKTALEVGAGAALSGQRVMVTMKQVGLNVASDPLMSLAYIGVKGGMVILVADDPGPISSQTEQDTRKFAEYSKLPVFDPSSPEEAFIMIEDAFEFSEKYETPVLFRPTTRVCHAYASVDTTFEPKKTEAGGFIKDSRWVIFPRLSYASHIKIEERNKELNTVLSNNRWNFIKYKDASVYNCKKIAAGGVSYSYVLEALSMLQIEVPVLKIGIPHPFPKNLAEEFLSDADSVLVCEELDPVIEKELISLCGEKKINTKILGKLDRTMPIAGENTVNKIADIICEFLGIEKLSVSKRSEPPTLPVRPPVLCAGCPHRASFYAVKQAMKGRKAVFCGDIGCYTLGNAMPLDMVDTCLCMGAGLAMAQGINRVSSDTTVFAFVGDSTFFHTGISGIVNAVYNNARMVAVILDNSTTAMTGHQPNPSTGFNAKGEIAEKIDIEAVLKGIGVKNIFIADPLNHKEAVNAAKCAAECENISAIIYKSPCIAKTKPSAPLYVDTKSCIGCKKCIRELGCPALVKDGSKVAIDKSLCFGCELCSELCPTGSIKKEGSLNA